MIYKNFRFNILVRILIIAALAVLFAFVILKMESLFAPIVIGGLFIATIFNLVRYIEKSNIDLTHFLLSLRQGTFMDTFTSGEKGKPFKDLSNAMNEIIREFAQLNLQKELHYQYLKTLNENINVAILSFDESGKRIEMNTAAKQLLPITNFSHLEDFLKLDPQLYEVVRKVGPDERAVTKVHLGSEAYHLGVQKKEIILQGKPIQILLLQNLSNELEAKEIEAWYQLIRVLTHEIMNSVTPITSLTAAVKKILTNDDGTSKNLNQLTNDNSEDIHHSVSTIESRSKGLLKFVNAYKDYAKPLELKREDADLVELVNRVADLFSADILRESIDLTINHKIKSLPLRIDSSLVEQVLINLIKNSIEAVDSGLGKIQIETGRAGNQVFVSVTDNGKGIDEEALPKIFIPFFTTKAKGSGIGLSLSRQIMKLHHGNIKVKSSVGSGSTFTLEFP